MSSFIIYTECVNLPIVQGIVCDFAVTQIKVAQFIKQLSHFTNIAPGASFILNSSCRRPFEKHRSSAIAFARRVVGSSFFMVIASPSDVFISIQPLIGVSLDIENYCTLRLLFDQSLVLDKVPEYGKPAKCCSPLHLLFL